MKQTSKSIEELQVKEVVDKRTALETVVPLEAPFIIYIDPCGACNFKCSFCPCNNSDFMPEERHKMMSFDLFKKIVNDMKEFKQKVKAVDLFCFGEPLLNKDFPKMVKYIKDSNVAQKVRTVTNGSLLTPDINDRIIESGLDVLRVSIEGRNNEDYKVLCGVNIDMDQIVNNIKDLYNKKTKQNKNLRIHIKAINSMLKTEEDRRKYFEMFKDCSDSCIIENVREIFSGFKVGDEAKKAEQWEYERVVGSGELCAMPLYEMVVHSNGVVSACCVDWKFALQYGDVNRESLRDIWHSKKLRDLQIKLIEGGKQAIAYCAECGYHGGDNIDSVKDRLLQRLKGNY